MCIYKWTLLSFARTGRTRMSASPTSTWRCLLLPHSSPLPLLPRSQQIVERNKRANSSIKKQRKSQIILMAIAWMIYKKKPYKDSNNNNKTNQQKQQKKGELASATCGNWQPHEFNTETLCMQHANGPTTTALLLLPLQQQQLPRCITV